MSTTFRLRAKRIAVSLSFASALAVPVVASADEPKKDCEPGSWFCGETEQGGSKDLQPLPAAKPEAAKPAGKAPPPPVVVYQPPPPVVVVQARDAPPPYAYVPLKAPPKKEWGLNVHIGGAMMGKGRDDNAGMGLAGLGLRYRPVPHFAIEGDIDLAGGRDYNGNRRSETALALNGLVFVNPRSTTQLYFLGGFGWSGAHVVDDRDGFDKNDYRFSYFGAQAGVGLEFRLSRSIALNVDLRGLIRGRIDENRRQTPEFVSGDGQSTNVSGAGLLTGGLTVYW